MNPIKRKASSSLLRNFLSRTFLTQVPTSAPGFLALRVFFSLAIIFYHGAFYLAASLSSGTPADGLINDFRTVSSSIFQIVYFGFRYGVDVFLFISGFFMASKIATTFRNGRKPMFIVRYLLLRWLRLAPMYLIVSVIHRLQGNHLCPNWTEILQMANLFSSAHHRCVIVGWSTIVDFQSQAVICTLALTAGNMRRMKCILVCCIAISGLARAWYWYQNGFPAWPIMFTAQEAESKELLSTVHKLPLGSYDTSTGIGALRKAAHVAYYPLYFDLRYRLAPCMIGFLTWVNMDERGKFYRKVVSAPLLSVISAAFLVCFDFGIVLNSHSDLKTFSVAASCFHEAFGSVIVLIGVSVGIMNLNRMQNISGSRNTEWRPIRAFLLLRSVWVRVLYAMYLGHPILLRSLHWWGAEMNDDMFTSSQVLIRGSILYISTGLLGLILSLVEQPFLEIRRWVAVNTMSYQKERHQD